MSKFALITAALLIIPSPGFAQIVFEDSPPPPPAHKTMANSDVDKVVCRMQDTLGSRLQARQVCMTKQQWSQYEQEWKNKVHDMQVLGLHSN
ncbi:MAG TPA: hypothetical protein VE820_01975 [Sphingomicrobium sp.]|nr:hypothetical protein [Sphingomicrobium sp.]